MFGCTLNGNHIQKILRKMVSRKPFRGLRPHDSPSFSFLGPRHTLMPAVHSTPGLPLPLSLLLRYLKFLYKRRVNEIYARFQYISLVLLIKFCHENAFTNHNSGFGLIHEHRYYELGINRCKPGDFDKPCPSMNTC